MNHMSVPAMTDSSLIAELQTLVEPGKVLTDVDSLNAYGKDWTKHFAPAPSAIVFPKSIEQVQAIVRWANTRKVALVPSGGRTGLSAAAVAANGEVVVSFDYMNQILEFNEMDRTAICQPGVITAQLQQFAEDKGLYYPVDFASAGSSQIGGNIGTNAGGIKVIRYGMTRNWVAGLKVVTGKGDLLELNKDLVKNATATTCVSCSSAPRVPSASSSRRPCAWSVSRPTLRRWCWVPRTSTRSCRCCTRSRTSWT